MNIKLMNELIQILYVVPFLISTIGQNQSKFPASSVSVYI